MMDNLFDIQYLVDNKDYSTISSIHRLWKKRKLQKKINNRTGFQNHKENNDDKLWDLSLNLVSPMSDSYKNTNEKVDDIFGDEEDEYLYNDTESSVDGSNKYEHVIPEDVESETDSTEKEMRDAKDFPEIHQINDEEENQNNLNMLHESYDSENSPSKINALESNFITDRPNQQLMIEEDSDSTKTYEHIIPNEAQDDSKEVVDKQKSIEEIDQQTDTDPGKIVEKSKTLVIPTPSDGSCFYHAISRYLNVNDRSNTVTILDLQSIVRKNVKDYESKHTILSQTEKKVSKDMRQRINAFIYDNVDLLVKLFPINNLMDDDFVGNDKKASDILKSISLESMSSDTKWAGTAQLFAFSLLTMTPIVVWVMGKNDKVYVKGTQTEHQLREMITFLQYNPDLQEELIKVQQSIKVKKHKNAVIHLLLHGYHYETLVLLE